MEVPDFVPYADKDWPGPEKGFAAVMRNIDRDVGRILDELQSAGLNENTIVMFSSDNGPHEEGGHKMNFFDSNGPLRGMKRDLYEGGIRVPLIVRWPGKIKANSVSHHICGFKDMLPTFAELAGAEVINPIDGLSILPELTGSRKQPQHDFLYWEFGEQGGKQAVLKGDWKLVQRNVGTKQPAEFELYNVAEDIDESTNKAAQHPELVDSLRNLLLNSHSPNKQFPLFPAEKASR